MIKTETIGGPDNVSESICPPDPSGLVSQVAAIVPMMRRMAEHRDRDASFPTEEMAMLREAGILAMALPNESASGRDTRTDRLARILTWIGMGNLPVGRVFEAHVNARHLIARYGTPSQRDAFEADIRDGHLFALWVTDPPLRPLRFRRGKHDLLLDGGKMFCSAAGFASRALVTAMDDLGGSQMLLVRLQQTETVHRLPAPLQGMRAAVTGTVDFTGCRVSPDALLGEPGDYLREPDFSGGAWRGSAVATGGLIALIEEAEAQLGSRGTLDAPHQRHRLGTARIASETSRLWVHRAAHAAEGADAHPDHAVALVGLARLAVEHACLDGMRLVQRSLGLAAFGHGNPVERIGRDLATYLRQPAPDEILSQAAAYCAAHPARFRP